ncbi:MAG TPA: kelch repeat-containing protein [Micromonosporaceae bacterium]|jgi:hypothetical protein
MGDEKLRALLTDLAQDVSALPAPESMRPAWHSGRRQRRRRLLLGAAAAVVLVAVPLVLLAPRHEPAVRPVQPTYSDTPLRGRAAHTATLLPDGRVLIIGGCATDGCSTADGAPSTEFYVPGHGFTPGPDLRQPRDTHTATLLADGRVLVVGGWEREGTSGLDSAEVFDPATGRFEAAGPLPGIRGGNTPTRLADGRVLVVSGGTAELFDPDSDTFTPAAALPSGVAADAAIGLADGRVLVVGATASALYDPGSDAWQSTGALTTPRDKFAIVSLPADRVLVLGGEQLVTKQVLRTTEIYDVASGRFEPGPTMDTERYKFSEAVAVDAIGRVIVGGGTELAILDGGHFSPVPGTTGSTRWFPTLTALPNGDVLLVGGYSDRISLRKDALLVPARCLRGPELKDQSQAGPAIREAAC